MRQWQFWPTRVRGAGGSRQGGERILNRGTGGPNRSAFAKALIQHPYRHCCIVTRAAGSPTRIPPTDHTTDGSWLSRRLLVLRGVLAWLPRQAVFGLRLRGNEYRLAGGVAFFALANTSTHLLADANDSSRVSKAMAPQSAGPAKASPARYSERWLVAGPIERRWKAPKVST